MAPIRIRLNVRRRSTTTTTPSVQSSPVTQIKKPVIILKVHKSKAPPKPILKLTLKNLTRMDASTAETTVGKNPAPSCVVRAQSVSSVASDISAVSGVHCDVYRDWMARNPVEFAVNMEETLANSALPFLMPSVEEPNDRLLPYVPEIKPRELIILPPRKTKEPEANACGENSSSSPDVATSNWRVDNPKKKKKRSRGKEVERK